MNPGRALGNGLATGLLAVVRCYLRFSPLAKGKSRLCVWTAIAVSRLSDFAPRPLPLDISGVQLALWVSPSSIVGVLIDLVGSFEIADVDACLRTLATRDAPVLLDVGANCGLYSLVAACGRPGVRVFAVEPDPDAGELLRRNVEAQADRLRANGSSVEIAAVALGAADTEATFHRSWDLGLGSLAAGAALGRGQITVPVRQGDAFVAERGLERIDFCKLDIEGGELDVLRGLSRTLAAGKIGVLQIELNEAASGRAAHSCEDLVGFLRTHGYEMTAESALRYANAPGTCENFRFARRGAGEGR